MPSNKLQKKFLVTTEESELIEQRAKKEGKTVSNMTREFWGLKPLQTGKPPKEVKKKK